MKTGMALLALLCTRLLSDSDFGLGSSGDLELLSSSADPAGSRSPGGAEGQPTDPSSPASAGDLQDIPPG